MSRYFKIVKNGYIEAISTYGGTHEISEDEYNNLMQIASTAPVTEGKRYRLKTDLTWEAYDIDPVEESPTAEELLDILTGESV